MTALGAVLLIVACTAMGLSAASELRRRVATLTEALAVLERMCSAVCHRLTPLPQVLRELEREHPGRFTTVAKAMDAPDPPDFAPLWRRQVEALGLWGESGSAMEELGVALSRGEPPERSFALCREALRCARALALARQRERGRLYTALGAAGGCLLALLLI